MLSVWNPYKFGFQALTVNVTNYNLYEIRHFVCLVFRHLRCLKPWQKCLDCRHFTKVLTQPNQTCIWKQKFCSDFRQCQKSKLFGNPTVFQCLKSIRDIYCIKLQKVQKFSPSYSKARSFDKREQIIFSSEARKDLEWIRISTLS